MIKSAMGFVRTPILFLSLILLGYFPKLALGEQIYVYVDPQGTIHFSDQRKHGGYQVYRSSMILYSGTQETDKLRELVLTYARKFGFDPLLIDALVEVESAYNPYAMSMRGALGLMQLIPETAERFGVEDPFDPVQNLTGGLRYLRYLWITFSGNLPKILAAYHAGESRVQEHKGIPPIASTREYVRRVLKLYNERKLRASR